MDEGVLEMGVTAMFVSIAHFAALGFGLGVVKWSRGDKSFIRRNWPLLVIRVWNAVVGVVAGLLWNSVIA